MSEPWIGDENASAPGRCVYGIDELDPSKGICGAPATVHIMSESAMHGDVSLAACDRHAPLARVAGVFLGEHPFGGGCWSHETWFRLDGCTPVESSGSAR